MKTSCGRTYRRRKCRKSSTLSSIPSHLDVNILLQWMTKRGYKHAQKLKPTVFSDTGRGLMTLKIIYPGDAIVVIPENLLITPKTVLDSSLGPLILKCAPSASGQAILSLFLLCEKSKGLESSYHPYISSLPDSYNTPSYFCSHACLAMPEPMRHEAEKRHDCIKTAFLLVKPLLEILDETDANLASFDLFKWAWCSVNTRSVFMKCADMMQCTGSQCSYHLALAPFLDLLNHSFDAQVTAGFNQEKKCYEIISQKKIKKQSQVFINYGCHDNLRLLMEYGFILKKNGHDHVTFSADDIVSSYHRCFLDAKSLPNRLKFINECNLLKNANCSMDGLSWNLNIILKILSSEYDLKLWNSFRHQNSEEPECQHFLKLKETLIKSKMAEYELKLTTKSCSPNCAFQLQVISELCSTYLSILEDALS